MKLIIKIAITLLVLAAVGLLIYELSLRSAVPEQQEKEQSESESIPEKGSADPVVKDQLPPGVNPSFYDSSEIQVGWMNHGLGILKKNLPDYATDAETKEVYFHRGFKGRAMVCGSVRFYRDGEIAMDYQRFIFPGLQVIYYENEIKNFQTYWDKVCVDISEEGLR